MAKYTIQIKSICESLAGYDEPQGLSSLDDILSKARLKIFDFDYPFYDQDKKADFEKWILRSIYMEEINYETFGLWHMHLWQWMETNMEYYSKMFQSIENIVDPFVNENLTRTTISSGKDKNTSSSNSSGTGLGWNMYSDTPQGGIEGLENSTYLTNATKTLSDNTGKNESNSESNASNIGAERVSGFSGITYSKMLKEYRESFANIKKIFIEDFKNNLCLKLWY